MAKSNIATAYVQVAPSAEGIKSKLTGVFNKEMPGAGSSAGSILGNSLVSKLKGVIAAAGIGKMLAESISAGASMQQSLGGIETLFKDSADKVIANAEQAYKTAGMSANEYMETVTSFSASLLQGLGGDTSKAADVADIALKDMSDNANKMGTDMEMIQNAYQGFAKQNYTMLDNLKLGYGGTKTEMQRLLADAQKLSGVKYDMSNLADVYEAIHVIQTEMDITGTTAKEAASTLSGSLASMKAAFSDVLANLSLGRDIGPSLKALGETVFTFLENNLLPMVGNILSALPELLMELFSTAVRGLNKMAKSSGGLVEAGTNLVAGLVETIVSNIPYLVEAGANIIAALAGAFLDMDWGQVCSDLMSGLRDSMDIAAGEIFGTDGDILGSLIDAIVAGIPAVAQKGVDIIQGLVDGIVQALPGILAAAERIIASLVDAIVTALPGLLDAAAQIITSLVNGIARALPGLLEAAVQIVSSLVIGIVQALPMIVETIVNLLMSIVQTIDEQLPTILDEGVKIITELVNGIAQALPVLFEGVMQALTGLVNTIIENLPQILEAGTQILLSIVDGIRQALPQMVLAAGDAIISMVTGIVEHLPEIIAAGIELVVSLISGIREAKLDLIGAAKQLIGSLWDTILEIDWFQLGVDIVKGLINGLLSMAGAFWDAIMDMCKSAFDGVKDFFGINSPSKLMADEIGRFIPPGIAVGVEGNIAPLENSLEGLADVTTGTLQAELSKPVAGLPSVSSGDNGRAMSVVINVYGAAGQSMEELAEIIMRKMQHEYARREAGL